MNFKPPVGTKPNLAHPLMQGLVGWWLFNEGAGIQNFDSSGYNNTGTMTAMANPASATSGWGVGKLGTSPLFDGINDYISVSGTNVKSNATTWGVWIKKNTDTSYMTVLSATEGGNEYTLRFDASGTTKLEIVFGYPLAGYADLTSPSGIELVKWIYATITSDGTTIKLYTNGIFVNSAAYTQIRSMTGLDIGRAQINTNHYFDGAIDDIRIYNKALSAQEVWQLYTNPFAMFERPKRVYYSLPGGTTFTQTLTGAVASIGIVPRVAANILTGSV